MVGFFGMLANLWQAERPRGVFIGWDTLGAPTYRNELLPGYQGGRVFDDAIVQQLDLLPTVCAAFGFGVGKERGREADDMMAAAVREETAAGGTCLVFTTDRDAYQLVSDRVTVLSPRRGVRELERVGPREVVAYFGVLPEQVPDYKALAGDSSDRIPGLRGVGPKAAAALLLRHGTLEGVMGARANPAETALAMTYREIARMRSDAAVTLPPTGPPDWAAGAAALRLVGAHNLADRLAALAR